MSKWEEEIRILHKQRARDRSDMVSSFVGLTCGFRKW